MSIRDFKFRVGKEKSISYDIKKLCKKIQQNEDIWLDGGDYGHKVKLLLDKSELWMDLGYFGIKIPSPVPDNSSVSAHIIAPAIVPVIAPAIVPIIAPDTNFYDNDWDCKYCGKVNFGRNHSPNCFSCGMNGHIDPPEGHVIPPPRSPREYNDTWLVGGGGPSVSVRHNCNDGLTKGPCPDCGKILFFKYGNPCLKNHICELDE